MRRILITFFVSCAIAFLAGCGHNTDLIFSGFSAKVGIDSQNNYMPTVSIIDGLQISDISRENSGWIVEVDSTTGISISKDGTIKGVKSFRRFIGPQMNGYLVDLSKNDPQLAIEYIKASQYFWQYQLKTLESK